MKLVNMARSASCCDSASWHMNTWSLASSLMHAANSACFFSSVWPVKEGANEGRGKRG